MTKSKGQMHKGEKRAAGSCFGIILRLFLLGLETCLLAGTVLWLGLLLLCRGPSAAAAEQFVRTVEETNRGKVLAELFFTPEEIREILRPETEAYWVQLQLSPEELIEFPEDTDGDGLVLQELHWSGGTGWVLAVTDPTRVVLAADAENFGRKGHTVQEFVELRGAVAGINGGAFRDPMSGMPSGLTVVDGMIYNDGVGSGFAGLDAEGRLITGIRSAKQAEQAGIRWGCSFGPVLVQNGRICCGGTARSGLNPRTAIGQRADGTILLLVLDGRRAGSPGATLEETALLLLELGAVNAVNLDGGSSSALYMNGAYVNRGSSPYREDALPDAFVVLKQEENG